MHHRESDKDGGGDDRSGASGSSVEECANDYRDAGNHDGIAAKKKKPARARERCWRRASVGVGIVTNVLLVIFTYSLARTGCNQVEVAQGQRHLMDQQRLVMARQTRIADQQRILAVAAQRAWLFISYAKLHDPIGEQNWVVLSFQNFGRSPAFFEGLTGYSEIFDRNQYPTEPQPDQMRMPVPMLVGGGEIKTRQVGPLELATEDVISIKAGTRMLQTHFRVVYHDEFGSWWSTFCFLYAPRNGSLTECPFVGSSAGGTPTYKEKHQRQG